MEQGTNSSSTSKRIKLACLKYDQNDFDKPIWAEWFCVNNKKGERGLIYLRRCFL